MVPLGALMKLRQRARTRDRPKMCRYIYIRVVNPRLAYTPEIIASGDLHSLTPVIVRAPLCSTLRPSTGRKEISTFFQLLLHRRRSSAARQPQTDNADCRRHNRPTDTAPPDAANIHRPSTTIDHRRPLSPSMTMITTAGGGRAATGGRPRARARAAPVDVRISVGGCV